MPEKETLLSLPTNPGSEPDRPPRFEFLLLSSRRAEGRTTYKVLVTSRLTKTPQNLLESEDSFETSPDKVAIVKITDRILTRLVETYPIGTTLKIEASDYRLNVMREVEDYLNLPKAE